MDQVVPACGQAEALGRAPCPTRCQCGQEPTVIKESAAMQPDNRSRRHFLAGCLAALIAWFVPWRKAVPAPMPPAVILPAGPVAFRETVTEYTYDGAGRLLRGEHLSPVPVLPPVWTFESHGYDTSYTYG